MNRVCSWIASLLGEGCRPEIFEIEAVPKQEWPEAERFWIAYWKSLGANLANLTDGGAATHGHRHSEETKARLSETTKKQFADPAARDAARLATTDQWTDEGFRESVVGSIKKRSADPEYRKKMSEMRRRQWAEDKEYRATVAAAQAEVDRSSIAKNFWQRPEYRQRQAEARERRRARQCQEAAE